MTVTLTPDIETRLRAYAEDLDLDPAQIAGELLTSAFEEADAELRETMEGLDRSAEDFAAGRWITPVELDRRLSEKLDAARARLNGTHAPERILENEHSPELAQAR